MFFSFQSNTSYKPQVTSSGVSKSQVLSAGPTHSAKRSYSETAVYRDIRRSVKEKHVTPEEKQVHTAYQETKDNCTTNADVINKQ